MENKSLNFLKARTKYIKMRFCLRNIFWLLLTLCTVPQIQAKPEESGISQQQNKVSVSGTVVDEKGDAIIGASIIEKGTNNGIVADLDGKFNINVAPNATLQISYLGYITQMVPVAGKRNLSIIMQEDSRNLDEVVVIGYGSQRIKDVTGSIVPVDMKRIEELPVTSISEALQGQIPGLSVTGGSTRPGVAASLSIRQPFTLSKDGGNQLPLVIIDDMIQTDPATGLATLEQFNMLDPSEVESITVLRDASAAIYGSRASQGAIVVKTKRGREGAPKISYSGKFMRNDAVGHTKTLNAHEYGVFANSFLRASGITDEANLYSDSELQAMKSLDYNWLDKAWSAATVMQHSLNVSGGSNKATYFAGASLLDQGANLGDQDFKRWTFRSGADVKLASNFKLSAILSGNNGKQEKSFTKIVSGLNDGSYGSLARGEQADYGILAHMPKYIPWSQTINGVEQWVSPALGPHKVSGTQVTSNQIAAWNYFGLLDNGSIQTNETFSYSANFALEYNIPFVKGLSVKGTYARSHSSSNTEQVQMPYTLALATNTNAAGTHLYTDQTVWSVKENNKNSRVVYSDVIGKSEQMNFYVNYDGVFGLHNISAMASVERSETNVQNKTIFYNNPIPGGYIGGSSSAGTLDPAFTEVKRSETGTLSYLGRASYNYAGKYLAQVLFRADASTKFAPENYWGFFPTLSLGWSISEESWFKDNIKWIDFLKVRASVGKTGKDNIKAWKWLQLYNYASDKGLGFGTSGGTLGPGVTPSATPNRNVRWDTSMKYNAGLDFNVLDNRLSASWDFYFDRNTNILMSLAGEAGVPIFVGGGFAEQNYGAIDAWGTEISINWRDKVGDFHYNIGLNYSFNDNNVRKYPEAGIGYPSDNATRVGSSTIFPSWGFKTWKGTSSGDGILRSDSDIDAYWNYLTDLAAAAGTTPSYLGITDKSKIYKGMLAYQDLNGDLNKEDGSLAGPNGRIIESEDFAKLVKKNRSEGFVTNFGLNWKGLSWAAQIETSWGGYNAIDNVKQGTSSNQMLWAHEAYLKDMFDEDNNINGRYPNLAYYAQSTGYASDFWQVSSFRCFVRSMSVGYTIPKHVFAKTGIDNAKVSLTGNNLWDFYNPYPNNYRNRYDNSSAVYPTLRTWALGVNLTF